MVFEIGLFDFHKMYIIVMKMYYHKQKASFITVNINDASINDRKTLILNLLLHFFQLNIQHSKNSNKQ